MSKNGYNQKNDYYLTKHGLIAYQTNQLEETNPESGSDFFLKGQLFDKNEVKGQIYRILSI